MADKTISLKLKASQFKEGDTSFNGGQVRGLPKIDPTTKKPRKFVKGVDEEPFVMVDAGGSQLRLEAGMWLVEYPNGTLEAWSDERMKAHGGEGTDARLEDEDIKKEAADKLVVNYKEHNPKISPLEGNAPVTGTEESKGSKSTGEHGSKSKK